MYVFVFVLVYQCVQVYSRVSVHECVSPDVRDPKEALPHGRGDHLPPGRLKVLRGDGERTQVPGRFSAHSCIGVSVCVWVCVFVWV